MYSYLPMCVWFGGVWVAVAAELLVEFLPILEGGFDGVWADDL